jgi:hypothetical protein
MLDTKATQLAERECQDVASLGSTRACVVIQRATREPVIWLGALGHQKEK